MTRHALLTAAAIGALSLTAAACGKSTNSATGADVSTPANAEAQSGNATQGNSLSPASAVAAKGADATNVAQDTASKVVGATSAATLGSVNTTAFISNAAQSDMYETQVAKLAEEKSKNPAIKKFARQMITDHAKSTKELTTIVNGGAVKATLPTGLDNRRQGLVDNLKQASTDDFDARYVDQQIDSHQEAETLMKGFADHGDSDQLKAFAAKMAPIVQGHLDMAKQIKASNADHRNTNAAPS